MEKEMLEEIMKKYGVEKKIAKAYINICKYYQKDIRKLGEN